MKKSYSLEKTRNEIEIYIGLVRSAIVVVVVVKIGRCARFESTSIEHVHKRAAKNTISIDEILRVL